MKSIINKCLSVVRSQSTIRTKLIVSFLVPIIFIFILGIASYKLAADSICNSFENSTKQTIQMTSQYIDLSFEWSAWWNFQSYCIYCLLLVCMMQFQE